MKPYPKVKLRQYPPSKNFAQWVQEFGKTRLARSLGVSRSLVHRWLGGSAKPTAENALILMALSKIEPLAGRKALTLQDIFGQADVAKVEVRRGSGSFRI